MCGTPPPPPAMPPHPALPCSTQLNEGSLGPKQSPRLLVAVVNAAAVDVAA